MPMRGALLQTLDKYPDSMVPQRISNTVKYIATLQAK